MQQPKLRFDGFNGEWEKYSLKDISIVKDGTHDSPDYHSTGYPLITSKNLLKDGSLDLENVSLISELDFQEINKRSKVDNGDILFGMIGTLGNPVRVKSSNFAIKNVALIKEGKVSNEFILHYLKSEAIGKQFYKHQAGGTQKFIGLGLIRDLIISLPEELETQKISSFFTLLDKRINRQQEKIEKLEQFKKGMMQKIFSQELRFKDENGGKFPEWEEKLIGDCLSESRIIGSKGDTAHKLTVKLWGKGVIAKKEAIQGSVNTQYYTRREGQLMYGKLDFLNCAFGIVPPEFDGYESTLDSPAFDIQNINSRFLLEYITRKEFYLKYGSQANGSRRAKRIHPDIFFEMPISVPSIKEQNEIGEFLDLLDEKVETEKEKLMVLEEQKRGFMQGMFV